MLILSAILMFVLAMLAFVAYQDVTQVSNNWPPISDDEFVAKCKPGTSRETALKVRRIVSEQLGVDYERLHPEQEFVRDLGC